MYRISESESMEWAELVRLAQDIGARLRFRRARCQHGKTRQQTCIDCEGGYGNDCQTFARVGKIAKWNGVPCVAVSDDGEDVAYLARRDEPKIARREPIEQIKAYAAGGRKTKGGIEWSIQKIMGHLDKHTRREMLCAETVVVENIDAAAWADIEGKYPHAARPSVRYLSDGSAVTCHYSPEGLPQYRRFVRG